MTASPEQRIDNVGISKDAMKMHSACVRFNDDRDDNLSTISASSKQSVSFDEVQVHEFAQWLGDNPSCSEGPPIALSWDCVHTQVLKLDEYETTRGRRR